jgi:CPA2 family monovalent cation:H+ antiporter-2
LNPDYDLLRNLVIVVAAAAIGGLIAVKLRQPVILGYLLVGALVGPFTPGPAVDFEGLRFLTQIGLALLLFVMGANLPVSKFRAMGSVILFGGVAQISFTILMGIGLAPYLNLTIPEGILLGAILAQSSSAAIIKILEDRREGSSVHGRIAVGMSVVQDLSSGPLLLLLLVFLGTEAEGLASLPLAVLEVIGVSVVVFLTGRLVWPRLIDWIGKNDSGEVTLLTALAMAIGSGLALAALGLSFTLGAFVAGLVAADAIRRNHMDTRLTPLRDVFAALFFVSIGMLFDPEIIGQNPMWFLAILGAAILGKALISAVTISIFRYSLVTATLGGILLAQVGEFGFIVADVGLDHGAISSSLFSLIIAAAIISIAINSVVLESVPRLLSAAAATRALPFALDKWARGSLRILNQPSHLTRRIANRGARLEGGSSDRAKNGKGGRLGPEIRRAEPVEGGDGE